MRCNTGPWLRCDVSLNEMETDIKMIECRVSRPYLGLLLPVIKIQVLDGERITSLTSALAMEN